MNKLVITQADRYIGPFKELKEIKRPKAGWIRYIRKAIGMTTMQLAKRAKLSRRRIVKIEEDELQDALTIKTLKNIANAMECQLIYAIIPKTTIMKTIQKQAKKIAINNLSEISHNMKLENQEVTDQEVVNVQIEEIIQQYINKSFKHLWNEKLLFTAHHNYF